jgi:hypothetical protein
MFGNAVSKVSITPKENYYISPLYKKDKIAGVKRIHNRKRRFSRIEHISKHNKAKMKEIFGEINLDDSTNFVYDERQSRLLSDYIYMGKYYDEIF